MGKAKDIILKPISSKLANAFVKENHYSGKVVQNSQLHIGVYLNGTLGGVMQFGPSLDKRKIQGLVEGTGWHEFLELNRMAFSDRLPRNSESRAIAIAMKLLKKHAPQVKWVISFADATQCGDGTIYRASGFVLTGIKENDQIWQAPTGARESRTSLTDKTSSNEKKRALVVSRTALTNLGLNGALKQRRELSALFGKDLTNFVWRIYEVLRRTWLYAIKRLPTPLHLFHRPNLPRPPHRARIAVQRNR